MPSIIAILGKENSGKTTTLWKVYLYLQRYASSARFFLHEKSHVYVEQTVAPEKIAYNENNRAIDFRAVLTIDQKVIAISSEGDFVYSINEGFHWALNYSPTCIVCAARDKKCVINKLQEYLETSPHKTYSIEGNWNEDIERENAKKIIEHIIQQ